jgi:superfamily I DNA/RNA helicase
MKLLTTEGYEAIALKRFRIFKNPGDLEYYDKVLQNGYKLDGDKVPVITTQHASKGRQAAKVIVFAERGRKCAEEEDAEHRLAYVATTRTKGDLEICAERMVDWAEMPYEYPIESAAPISEEVL